jgi:sulfur carrier protein ThiS
MNLILNGTPYRRQDWETIPELLKEVRAVPAMNAITADGEGLRRSHCESATLKEGDEMELIIVGARG